MSTHYTDLREFCNAVQNVDANLSEWALEVLMENAELIQGLAQILVRVRTGALRDSIRVERQGNTIKIVAGSPTVNYAQIVEAKYPYMAPAFNQVVSQIPDELRNRISVELERK